MTENVLIVEDDSTLRETLEYNLKRQGYGVLSAADGLQGLTMARTEKPDLILLDIMLPKLDGIELCRILRQETSVPILMLTARDEEIDKVVGLEMGADDYLTKPFSMRELLARVKALLRRARMVSEEREKKEPAASQQPESTKGERIVTGDLVIDLGRREVLRGGIRVPMKPKEFDLLTYLAQNRGFVLSRDRILEHVWGWDYVGDSRTVDVHVRWLRQKLEKDPTHPQWIVTVRGAGYRFEG